MKDKTHIKNKSIVILGGGVAGLSAATILGRYNLSVHLVEKSDRLGGHAGAWACMATDTCQNCGACLVPELSETVNRLDNVTVHLSQTITHIKEQNHNYLVTLSSEADSPLLADKIILATGFSPILPDGLMGEKHQAFDKVITTAELNELVAGQKLEPYFSKNNAPRIGFIQCVGSRNRLQGKDYCSQVCCKVSLRHINKLLALYPEADISMFYIDLQILGKETRSAFEALKKNVRLIQGVPFDIMDTKQQDMLTLIREDNTARARIADHFDMIVLSVGITPNSTAPEIARLLDLKTDPWGFFINPDSSGNPGIHVAGSALGPRDILSCKAQGEDSARMILKELGMLQSATTPVRIAVIGDGKEALQVAHAVRQNGCEALVIGGEKSNSAGKLVSIAGTVNRFELGIKNDTHVKIHEVCAIIVAEPVEKTMELSGLELPEGCIFSIEHLAGILETEPDRIPDRIVFHLGTQTPPPKQDVQTAMSLASGLKEAGKKVSVIIRNLPVNGKFGQRAYDRARKLGIRFFRINTPEDVWIQKTDRGIGFIIKDAFLFDTPLKLEADWLIGPEIQKPGREFKNKAALLKVQTDCEGFFQVANVRYRLTGSPRKGIFFTGSCHDDIDLDDLSREIRTILLSIEEQKGAQACIPASNAVINEGKCARCLTCYRVCPHAAIVILNGIQPYVVPDACVSCGLCLSSCPALAITQTEASEDAFSESALENREVIFACERSSAIAAKNIVLTGNMLLVKVPCVCRVSTGTLLKTLLKGAGRITLAGCHPGNCRSLHGSMVANYRAKKTNRLIESRDETVMFKPFAANEPVRLQQFLSSGKK